MHCTTNSTTERGKVWRVFDCQWGRRRGKSLPPRSCELCY